MTNTIPIVFEVAIQTTRSERPKVVFEHAPVQRGGSTTVRGQSAGGWVFCGIEEDGCGQLLSVRGAVFESVSGFTGDDSNIEFCLTHDGEADEIVVTYNTRAD